VISRLLGNPFVVVLAAIAVFAVLVSAWAVGVAADDHGMSWSGAPSEEQLWQLRINRLANFIPAPAAMVMAFALLGVIVIGAVSSRALTPEAPENDQS
jgi:hypothetical protein